MKNTFVKIVPWFVVVLGMILTIHVFIEIMNHVNVKVEIGSSRGVQNVRLTTLDGMTSIFVLPNGWNPCQRFEEPLVWIGTYTIYFVPDQKGQLKAQMYSNSGSELIESYAVKLGSKPYKCPPLQKVEGEKVFLGASELISVSLNGFPLGGFEIDSHSMLPVLLTEIHPETIRLLPGDWSIVYIPQQERFILLLDGKILASGKVT